MNIINKISMLAIPTIILLVIFFGVKEKNKIYDTFIDGVKEGIEVIVNIFPTLIAVFLAVGLLRSSGVLELFIKILNPLTTIVGIPSEIMPLMLIRPISGSSSIAVATDIITKYGVDSNLGLIASTIMGSTETTLYAIAIYTSCVKIKKIRFVLAAALIADITGMLVSVVICRFLS